MDQRTETMTALLLGSGRPIPDDLVSPPSAIMPLRVGAKRHYVFARTMMVHTSAIESSGLTLEEVTIGDKVYRVSRAVIGTRQEGALRVLTAHTLADEGWSKCTLVAARMTPWTPEVANTVLRHAFGGVNEIKDGLWHPAKITRIIEGSKPGLFDLMNATSTKTDTYTLVAHALTGAKSGSKTAVLEAALADYPWLINASLLIDPTKFSHLRSAFGYPPDRAVDGFFHVYAYLLNADTIKAVAELVSEPSPTDLHLDTVRAWIKEMAVARCSYRWPQRPFVHALVDHFGDWLRGSKSATPAPAAPEVTEPSHAHQREVISLLQGQLAQAIERAAEQTRRAEEAEGKLHTCEDRLTRSEAARRLLHTENKDLHTQLRVLRAEQADLHTVSQEPPEVSQEEQQDEEDVKLLLDLVENAPGILRTPRRWEELVECASKLKHVSVTDEAVEPAIKRLAHHRHSRTLLGTSWNALRALDAWMAVPTGERGAFNVFLERHPQRGMSPGRVAGGETASLRANESMRSARVFKTALGDYREMFPHIRLNSQSGSNAARLHYCVDNELGVAHIGYIGVHLPNTHTPNV